MNLAQPPMTPGRRWLLALALAALAGCGSPAVYPVKGKVTLDDEPLPNATVFFLHKEDKQKSATGITNQNGEYTLDFGPDAEGVHAGTYEVRISTYNEGNPDDEPPTPAVPERVPARYNTQTTLTAEVKAEEENKIDFALEGGGEIDQPRPTVE